MAYYPTNRGVDSPIEIAGLKGQYMYIACGIIIGLFILAVILSNTSVNIWLIIVLIGGLIYASIHGLIRASQTFGVHGLMKIRVALLLPKYVKNSSRINDLIKKQ